MAYLADPHNFGKKVEFIPHGDPPHYVKPRPVNWEWLILGDKSPLRLLWRSKIGPLSSLDYFLPRLTVHIENHWLGQVEHLELDEYRGSIESESSQNIGYLFGLIYYFGLGDMHDQNIVSGINPSTNQFCFTPIDVEQIFEDYHLVSESNLISPFTDQSNFNFGYRHLLKYDSIDLPALIHGFIEIIHAFEKNKVQMLEVLKEIDNISDWPIRVIPRSTREYARAFLSSYRDFFPEELSQLKRGDIPYFYRTLREKEIFYFTTPSEIEIVTTELKFRPGCTNFGKMDRQFEMKRLKGASIQLFVSLFRLQPPRTLNFRSIFESTHLSCRPTSRDSILFEISHPILGNIAFKGGPLDSEGD